MFVSCGRFMTIYDEVRRRSWSERANNGDLTLDIESEAAEIDKGCLIEAEGIYDAIGVPCRVCWACRLFALLGFS